MNGRGTIKTLPIARYHSNYRTTKVIKMSNSPTMKSRYERLALDAQKHAPNPAQEASENPVVILGMNTQGELLRGVLLDDSIYHFFVVKTYKIHVEQPTAPAVETMSFSYGATPTTRADSNDYGILHFILLFLVLFLVSQGLRALGFK